MRPAESSATTKPKKIVMPRRRRKSFGSIALRPSGRNCPDVWVYRWMDHRGPKPIHRAYRFATVVECPTRESALRCIAEIKESDAGRRMFHPERVSDERSCEICGDNYRLCQDHNHETGMMRGTLCSRCNSAIGLFHDHIHLCRKAARYLLKYHEQWKAWKANSSPSTT